jgi:hypothetical protein
VVPVLAGDTEATLHERIKVVERTLYPTTVAWALGELQTGRSIEAPARLATWAGAVGVGAGVPRGDGRTRGEGADEEMTS